MRKRIYYAYANGVTWRFIETIFLLVSQLINMEKSIFSNIIEFFTEKNISYSWSILNLSEDIMLKRLPTAIRINVLTKFDVILSYLVRSFLSFQNSILGIWYGETMWAMSISNLIEIYSFINYCTFVDLYRASFPKLSFIFQ